MNIYGVRENNLTTVHDARLDPVVSVENLT